MLLVDTSVWINHLRKGDDGLAEALQDNLVIIHPHVLGELALGNLKDRSAVLSLLRNLPEAVVATDEEVQTMIEEQSLFGRGISYTDAHLLAAVRLTPEARLWTRDMRLSAVATSLDLGSLLPYS